MCDPPPPPQPRDPPPLPHFTGATAERRRCQSLQGGGRGEFKPLPTISIKAFQPHPRLSADQTTPTPPPNMNPTVYSPPPDFLLRLPLPVCFCPSNLSCVLRQWSVALTGRRYRSGGRKKWAFIFSTALVAPTPPKKLKLNIHIALNDF